ncbi:response regulator [Uliginosibacterium sp. H1]|uniref:response regulator n=1 Tax=Uliginosibacterium sp. H1 TaxID=3114757 RepID=UPI002E18C2FC|nr:response regulator [Uliginosibacterium sp. H1]
MLTEQAFKPANILIVDDMPEKLLVFKTVLEDLGQNLVMAHSGAEALREILHRDFAVILLDVNMPDIDGLETASMIRRYKRTAHTPIIFITAFADEMQTARGYSLGAVDYILSPVVPEVLRSKVMVFVQLHEMQRRSQWLADERIALMQAESARRTAEEATRRANFLSRASRDLGTSLDPLATMQKLLELVAPGMADLAILHLDMDDQPASMLIRHAGSDAAPAQTSMVQPFEKLPAQVVAILRQHLSDDTTIQVELDPLAGAATDDELWRNDLRNLLLVPIRAGDRALGLLALANARPSPAYAPQDLATIDELASRAAIAFDNARLYRNLQQEIIRSREAEEGLQDASRRKDEFLAMLSHELRNPLAPIRNAVEIIRRLAPPEPALTWARDVVDRQVTHLARLVEELLDVSRISQGKIALKTDAVELGNVVAHGVETVRPLIEARKHTLVVSVPEEPVWLRGDFARLAQVVSNLLNNAAKYTPDGGRIELLAGNEDDAVMLRVRDNGIGIDAALLPRIFDLFAQGERSLDRSQGGLGIGLTLVQRLVEMHGGSVQACSDGIGRGAEFIVALPAYVVSAGEGSALVELPRQARQEGRGARVVVVDDNNDAAESVAAFLRLEGHEVKIAGDGKQALACVEAFSPHVVVLDIGLPGMNGYEVAKALRGNPHTSELLLIALTGYGQKEDQAMARDAGFDHHFMKPSDPHALQTVIMEWADAAGHTAAIGRRKSDSATTAA